MNVKVLPLYEGVMVYWDEVPNTHHYHLCLYLCEIGKHRHFATVSGSKKMVIDLIPTMHKLDDIIIGNKTRRFAIHDLGKLPDYYNRGIACNRDDIKLETEYEYIISFYAEDIQNLIIDKVEDIKIYPKYDYKNPVNIKK